MHVALIANTAWMDEELASLHHIVVGLIDESVRVVQVLPRGRAEGEVVSFGTRLSWQEGRRRWRNRRALRQMVPPLREEGVGLVHGLDGRVWRSSLDIARQIEVPVVLSANSIYDVSLARECSSQLVPGQSAIVCATQPLTNLIEQVVGDRTLVRFIPPGVHTGNLAERRDEEAPCIVISGNGGYDSYVGALLEGAKQVVAVQPDLQLFFDGQGADPHQLWRAISRNGLLTNSTLIPRRLGHREVLLRAGALLHPQPQGRARSLTLRAMAHAVPVLACADPVLDYLIDGQTARVLYDPTPDAWARALVGFATKPGIWRGLGQSAQQWISENRLASNQLELLLHTYRELTGEPIAFPGPGVEAG